MNPPRLVIRRLLIVFATVWYGCGESGNAPGPWHQESGYQWRTLGGRPNRTTGFTTIPSASSGITFANMVSDSVARSNRILVHGGGVAFGDVDGDGLTDLYFARPVGSNALYRNKGGLKFEDVTVTAGVAMTDRMSTAAVFADVDGDGDLDLLVNTLGGPNELFKNDGTGKFTPDTTYPGRDSQYGSVTMTLADVDGDGDLDLYIANHKPYTTSDRNADEQRTYSTILGTNAQGKQEVIERWRRDYRLTTAGGKLKLEEQGDPDLFYLNDGHGKFERIPMASRWFRKANGDTLDDELPYFGLAARFYDINGDGAPDLYVANDFQHPDQIWINDGTGHFRMIGPEAIRSTSNATMAVDFGDVNRDGSVDIFEVDMLSLDPKKGRREVPGRTGDAFDDSAVGIRPQYPRNALLVNRGDGTFLQMGEMARVDASDWTWSTLFLDVDLDGYEDILVGNGNRWNETDGDILDKHQGVIQGSPEDAGFTIMNIPNYAFRNRGDLTFEEVGTKWRFSAESDISHGMAVGDLDGDGDLDVVINRLNREALVLRNDAVAPRIAVRLKGSAPNTSGIGAKVRIRGGPVPIQEREVTAGGLYLSHAEPLLTFATGAADSVEIEVVWRNGDRSTIPNARPDREYLIDQAGARPDRPAPANDPPTLFVDATSTLGHVHVESPFPDEQTRQPLLDNSLADLGPGISVYDLDHDGRDDLIPGVSRESELVWYRNDGGHFQRRSTGFKARGDLTSIIPVPNPSGKVELIVGQSNYESLLDAQSMTPVVAIGIDGKGGANRSLAGADTSSVGPIAVADVDGDTDLDVFVGGRVVPGEYPRNPRSHLLRNRGDNTYTISPADDSLFAATGMVSGAVFVDVDDDHDQDLLLATEWGPIRLYLNQGGRFAPAPKSWGFDRLTGRWNGITTGDFDGDGKPDLVTTSFGRNRRNVPDTTNPLILFFGNFDQDAAVDLVLGQYDSTIKKVASLTSFIDLKMKLKSIADEVGSFATFANASVEEILGPEAPINRLEAATLDNTVWLNRGDHFEPRPLPNEAQQAPAFAPVVADLDGDGKDDLVLAENYSGTRLNMAPWNDGRALVLLGSGDGRFHPMPGQRSGVVVYGDQRGAAAGDFDGDNRVDLVITQNGDSTRLFLNRGAAPGIRVRLAGPPLNRPAYGASVRLRCGDRLGARREIQGGGGYWSLNSPAPILGRPGPGACAVLVTWPNGAQSSADLPNGAAHLTIAWPGN